MSENVKVTGYDGEIDRHPDQCPLCHNKIIPTARCAHKQGNSYGADLQIVYSCPNARCEQLFIATFSAPEMRDLGRAYTLRSTSPWAPTKRQFHNIISSTSSSFCEIYNEALAAEHYRLMQICGVGYRKSLEFLIKDYVTAKHPDQDEKIKTTLLAACIESYVGDRNIKEVAKRATWLGNDETHYERRWVDKDLHDLKVMIDLVLHWIQAEKLTEDAIANMQP